MHNPAAVGGQSGTPPDKHASPAQFGGTRASVQSGTRIGFLRIAKANTTASGTMKTFTCAKCSNLVHFENVLCLACQSPLGFDPETMALVTLAPASDGGSGLVRLDDPEAAAVTYCDNAAHAVCNWLRPTRSDNGLCVACRLNRTIPNLAEPGGLAAWASLEIAKKRLIYSLMRLSLPLDGGATGNGPLTFDFVRDATTGHLDGVVTIDVSEADAVERERQRTNLAEPYRSLLGHLRHETGHYYWSLLIADTPHLERFRAIFGDERVDYAQALADHYAAGPSAVWQPDFVSAYASAHPWEDWSETWAHYLHMVDTLDTAAHVGMMDRDAMRGAASDLDPYYDDAFDDLLRRWLSLTMALNSINRSMGHGDFYPFVITPRVQAKLRFIHELLAEFRAGRGPGPSAPA